MVAYGSGKFEIPLIHAAGGTVDFDVIKLAMVFRTSYHLRCAEPDGWARPTCSSLHRALHTR
jgi:hypothetical protein